MIRTLLRRAVVRSLVRVVAPEVFFGWYCRRQATRARRGTYVLSFDCDYQADMAALPEVLDTLAAASLRASFAVVGRRVEGFSDLHRRIVEDGHEVLNHTYSHPERDAEGAGRWFHELDSREREEQIVRCHQVCVEQLGVEPLGFRAPHFGETHRKEIYTLLKQLGYRYSSSTVAPDTESFGAPFMVGGIIEFPLGCSALDPFLIFDSWSGTRRFPDPDVFVNAFARTVAIGAGSGAWLTHYFDPGDIIKHGRLQRLCDILVRTQGSVEVTTYREVLRSFDDGGRGGEYAP